MSRTPTKAAAKTAVKKVAAKAPAKKAAVQAPAKKATVRKATGDPAKSTAAKPAPAKKTAKKATATQRGTNRTATVNRDELKAVRGVDSQTSIVFERTFPAENMHLDWAEACRRVARDALSAPVSTSLDVKEVKAGTKVRATFTQVRGLPSIVH